MKIPVCLFSILLLIGWIDANPQLKKGLVAKTKSGAKGGFYSSRFGSVYDAKDFEPDSPTTIIPERVQGLQIQYGVAGHHQQNLDGDINAEIPNVEDATGQPLTSDDLKLGVKGGIKGGVKGGTKGYRSNQPRFEPIIEPSTVMPESGELSNRLTARSRGRPLVPESFMSSSTVKPLSRKTKTKGIKGGDRGYQFETKRIKDIFSDSQVTEVPAQITTVETYSPQILHLPTEGPIFTTENYRQETIPPQQTEAPYQQTETPYQQTELPYQQTEPPYQKTEPPYQQTEPPYQQTQVPVRETEPTTFRPTYPPTTYEPIQETQAPEDPQVTQAPELPVQTTYIPTTEDYGQQTELPVQFTQRPEVPYQTTVIPDVFHGISLGIQGRHNLKGLPGGKGKGKGKGKGWSKSGDPSIELKSSPRVRLPDDLQFNRKKKPLPPKNIRS